MSNNIIQDIAAWKESLTRMDDSRLFRRNKNPVQQTKTNRSIKRFFTKKRKPQHTIDFVIRQ